MVAFRSSTIYLTRADGVQLTLSLQQSDGSEYLIQPTDLIHFLLLKEPSNKANVAPILTREFSHPGYPSTQTVATATMNLKSEDTKYLNGDEYYYTIIITHQEVSGSSLVPTYAETALCGRLILEY